MWVNLNYWKDLTQINLAQFGSSGGRKAKRNQAVSAKDLLNMVVVFFNEDEH